jgi:hypothetical protein
MAKILCYNFYQFLGSRIPGRSISNHARNCSDGGSYHWVSFNQLIDTTTRLAPYVLKHFTAISYDRLCSSLAGLSTSLICLWVRILALPTIIQLGWKGLKGLAYYERNLLKSLHFLMALGPWDIVGQIQLNSLMASVNSNKYFVMEQHVFFHFHRL